MPAAIRETAKDKLILKDRIAQKEKPPKPDKKNGALSAPCYLNKKRKKCSSDISETKADGVDTTNEREVTANDDAKKVSAAKEQLKNTSTDEKLDETPPRVLLPKKKIFMSGKKGTFFANSEIKRKICPALMEDERLISAVNFCVVHHLDLQNTGCVISIVGKIPRDYVFGKKNKHSSDIDILVEVPEERFDEVKGVVYKIYTGWGFVKNEQCFHIDENTARTCNLPGEMDITIEKIPPEKQKKCFAIELLKMQVNSDGTIEVKNIPFKWFALAGCINYYDLLANNPKELFRGFRLALENEIPLPDEFYELLDCIQLLQNITFNEFAKHLYKIFGRGQAVKILDSITSKNEDSKYTATNLFRCIGHFIPGIYEFITNTDDTELFSFISKQFEAIDNDGERRRNEKTAKIIALLLLPSCSELLRNNVPVDSFVLVQKSLQGIKKDQDLKVWVNLFGQISEMLDKYIDGFLHFQNLAVNSSSVSQI